MRRKVVNGIMGLLAATVFGLAGCATTTGSISINDEKLVSQVQKGKTKQEVKNILGEPESISKHSGRESWTYTYTESNVTTSGKVFVALGYSEGLNNTKTNVKVVTVNFDANGLVEDVSESSSREK